MVEALAELILQNEKNDFRFEQFCIAILGAEEGVTYVPTSQSWDLGRDGRSLGRSRGSHANLLCVTLNKMLDAKVEADLLRLTASATPDRIVYCSSQKLSEESASIIDSAIRRHVPNGSVLVLGATQLALLGAKCYPILEKYYAPEILELKNTVFAEQPTGAASKGLRLALIAFGSDEGTNLRREVLYATLLDRLSEETSTSSQDIATSFSLDLGLPRSLPQSFIDGVTADAQARGDIFFERGWRLTNQGATKKVTLPLEAAAHLLEGRSLVREQLETLIGTRLADKQYGLIWAALLDCLGGLFYANGLDIIKAVENTFSGEKIVAEDIPDLKQLLNSGLKRAASIVSTTDLRDVVYRGLLDIFTERESKAFDWLTRVAERFIIICSLGLENTSGEALRQSLTSQRIILDSDIVLDYLCKAEKDHGTSRDLLLGWLKIGGRILVSPIVLEEVAHHAWISERDFKETENLLGKLSYYELTRYIKSAFVRTFHTFNAPASQWSIYLNQFRGNSSGDYTKILAHLRQQLKVEILPASYNESLQDNYVQFLSEKSNPEERDLEHVEDVNYKVQRDGQLLASIAAARHVEVAAGLEEPMVLLTSSRILRLATMVFQKDFGEGRVVLHKRAFAYLLASIPQASLGADTLRRALFEFGSHAHLKSSGRKALRLIRASKTYDLPWAERITLQRQLSAAIKEEAAKRGRPKAEIYQELKDGSNPETSAMLIVKSIQNLGIPSDVVVELEETKRRLKALENEVAQQNQRRVKRDKV